MLSSPYASSHHNPQIKILIVDDETGVLHALKRLFRGQNFQVELSDNAVEALDLVKVFQPDVILSDMRMPQMSGDEFLIKVRAVYPDIPCIVLSAFAEVVDILNVVNEANVYAYVSKPWDEDDLKEKVCHAANEYSLKRSLAEKNHELKMINRTLDLKVKQRTAELIELNDQLQQSLSELDESYNNAVNMLAYFIDKRFPQLQGHSHQVSLLSTRLAHFMGLPEQEIKDIKTAALLHDIGLLSLPEHLVTMEDDHLSSAEVEQAQQHPVIGEAIVSGMPVLSRAAKLIRWHHENYDGSGFPDGLANKDIPCGAKIINIANFYDGLVSSSSSASFNQQQALDLMMESVGHKFDPELMSVFIKMLSQFNDDELKGHELVTALRSDELQPGMILYNKLMTKSGMMLLAEDHLITTKAIEGIRTMERAENVKYTVYVYTSSIKDHD